MDSIIEERIALCENITKTEDDFLITKKTLFDSSKEEKNNLCRVMRENRVSCVLIRGIEHDLTQDVYIKLVETVPKPKLTLSRFRKVVLSGSGEDWKKKVDEAVKKVKDEEEKRVAREKHEHKKRKRNAL